MKNNIYNDTNKNNKERYYKKDNNDTYLSKKIWSSEQEQLLIAWAEKASGYAWLHSKCIHYYKKRNWFVSIPAAIFGYLAGATTLLSNQSFDNFYIKGAVGFSAILGGIFSNFQQMFTFKELTEQHRLSTLRFLSFFRDISCELSMHPSHRTNPIDYINMKRLEMDKMLEQSPSIPDSIIDIFINKTRYSREMHKPEVANVLQTIVPYGQKMKERFGIKYKKKLSITEKKVLTKAFRLWKKRYYINTKKKINMKTKNTNFNNETLNVEVANSVSHIDINNVSDNEEELRLSNEKVLGFKYQENFSSDESKNNNINNNISESSTFSSDDMKSPSLFSSSKLRLQNIKINKNPLE